MTGAFLTTLLFSLSVIFANRSIAALGAMRANLGRLTLAVIVLGTFAHTLGNGLHGAGLHWFLLSGVALALMPTKPNESTEKTAAPTALDSVRSSAPSSRWQVL